MTVPDDPQVKPNLPQEEHIIALISSFQPKPRQQFQQRMLHAPWNKEKKQFLIETFQSLRTFPRNAVALLSLFLVLILFIFTPALVSNARQFLRFFLVHDENVRSIEVTQTPTFHSYSSLPEFEFTLSIEEVAKAVNFPIKILPGFPEGISLEGAAYDDTRKAVLINYSGEGSTFLFTQREAASVTEYASVGSSAPAELVTVRGLQGEFISGGWVVQSTEANQPESGAQTINLVWKDQAGMWTLRWEENGIVYEIVVASSQSISLDEILAIAESMR